MTAGGEAEEKAPLAPPPPPQTSSDILGPGSVGRVDWSPLSKLTNVRPYVSKYGLPRYSLLEWRTGIDSVMGDIPSADALEHESKNIITQISAACDKEQSENTLRLRQRAVDITAKHAIVCQYCDDLRKEVEQMAQCKLRLRKALESLGVVEGINLECREIRRNRLTEDLVRDDVEEELFQEMGLCQEIKMLYNATLNEYENQYAMIKKCYQEVHSIWSDQRETLDIEARNIELKSSSDQISFCQGNARFEENSSSLQLWENYMNGILGSIKETIEMSKSLRVRIDSPILSDAAKHLKEQDQKVLKALLRRIDEIQRVITILEGHLIRVLKEIAHAEALDAALVKLGRQMDFNLKVVQTRLDNRLQRPGAERCRDKVHFGLIEEMKGVTKRVSELEMQQAKIRQSLEMLYGQRKVLERQIHVKKHSLSLDRSRCLLYRKKYPNGAYLLGF